MVRYHIVPSVLWSIVRKATAEKSTGWPNDSITGTRSYNSFALLCVFSRNSNTHRQTGSERHVHSLSLRKVCAVFPLSYVLTRQTGHTKQAECWPCDANGILKRRNKTRTRGGTTLLVCVRERELNGLNTVNHFNVEYWSIQYFSARKIMELYRGL